jgi:N-dimethylarginine dimethylaminohydrolase
VDKRQDASAYGGKRWTGREKSMREEIGSIWRSCGINSEWAELKAVLLHRPGEEFEAIEDPDEVNMIDIPEPTLSGNQHDALAEAFRRESIDVMYVNPSEIPPPNLMFVADLFFMTPEGAILSRPASSVRAGEERLVSAQLATLGVPILRSISGSGTFEGADAAWIDSETVMLGLGLRTNIDGATQVARILEEMDVEAIPVDLRHGSMHLMGDLRFVDTDVAVCREGRTPLGSINELQDRGFSLIFVPNEEEVSNKMGMNFVTLGRNKILMPKEAPNTLHLLEDHSIDCHAVEISELTKAAGGIGCITGVLEREIL